MKKFFSILCALAIVLSASAVPQMKLRGEQKQKFEVEVPAFTLAQRVNVARPAAFRAPAGTPVSGIASAQCIYYDGVWYLDAYNANDEFVAEFGFYNGYEDKIAGQYSADGQNAIAMVVAGAGDTVSLSGNFNIAYVAEGTQYPIYRVTATDMTDTLSRTFDFDFQVEVYAWDYMNYMYCLYYQAYCDEVDIVLADAPVVPTEDTVRISINNLKWIDEYLAEEGWWQIAGYSADSMYYVTMSNMGDATVAVGTYDFATEMDKSYSLLYVGDTKISFESGTVVVSQNADETYHVVATLLARSGDVYVLTLDSKLVVPSENVITMAYDANTRSISINTTNADPYFFYIESQEEYAKYETDYTQESLIEEIEAWIYTMQQYSVLSYYTFTGNQVISAVDFFGSYAATDDYIALAAPIEDAKVNGTAAYLLFHFDYPEAIENTEAAAVATKRIVNGQLVIEKNGVLYNAEGAVIK